jgi:adenylate kinase family enzyme
MARIHITGASGSGTTTLGRALAARLGCSHHDADDFFWLPTEPPYTDKRSVEERNSKLINTLRAGSDWVLSGSVDGWDSHSEILFELVVFLWVPTELRLARLQAREEVTFGKAAISPGGDQYEAYREFIDWAARYDIAGVEQRSRVRHEAWLAALACPVLRIEGDTTIDERINRVLARLHEI